MRMTNHPSSTLVLHNNRIKIKNNTTIKGLRQLTEMRSYGQLGICKTKLRERCGSGLALLMLVRVVFEPFAIVIGENRTIEVRKRRLSTRNVF